MEISSLLDSGNYPTPASYMLPLCDRQKQELAQAHWPDGQ